MPTIRFNYADVPTIHLSQKKKVKSFIAEIFSMEEKRFQLLDYIFCSDDYLLQINKTFLKHDFYTDIVTFDLSVDSDTVSEIYISVDRVRENAHHHHVSFQVELLRVIFHGALHLIGYKDKNKSEITLMRQKEDYYLRLFLSK